MSDIRVSWKSSYNCCTKNLHTNSLKSRRGFIRTKLKCVMKKPSDINNIKTLHVKHWFVVTSVEPHNVTQYFVAFSAALLWALSTLQTIVATGSDCVLFHLVGNYELGSLSQVQVWSWDAKEEVKVRNFFLIFYYYYWSQQVLTIVVTTNPTTMFVFWKKKTFFIFYFFITCLILVSILYNKDQKIYAKFNTNFPHFFKLKFNPKHLSWIKL